MADKISNYNWIIKHLKHIQGKTLFSSYLTAQGAILVTNQLEINVEREKEGRREREREVFELQKK